MTFDTRSTSVVISTVRHFCWIVCHRVPSARACLSSGARHRSTYARRCFIAHCRYESISDHETVSCHMRLPYPSCCLSGKPAQRPQLTQTWPEHELDGRVD